MTNHRPPAVRLGSWLLRGEWRAHPLRALVAVAAIALGVALGFAIHLINAAAFNEFSAAVKSLSGQSDLQVRASSPYLDETLYPWLAGHDGIDVASPVLEVDAGVNERKQTLQVLGIDVFRAAAIAPDLVGLPARDRPFDTLADDAIFLSPAAMQWLGVHQGQHLMLRVGSRSAQLRVAGGLVHARAGQRIGVMDIGSAQWRLGLDGKLSHIDLKLAPGIDRAAFKTELERQLRGHYLVTESADQDSRTASMSRAYRVNLNVLALVALFTGAFLVFSTQALSVLRRRSQLALLRVMGMTRRRLLLQILLESGLLGVLGAGLGLAAGYAIAALVLRLFGGDLGGGYFPGVRPSVQFAPLAALVFFMLGIVVALLGGAGPAWEAARAQPAQALKSGNEDLALARLGTPWPALACILLGIVFTQLPPVSGLPLFGYLAVALLLVGGIGLMPRLCALAFGVIARRRWGTAPVAVLALARLANAPNQASIALGGVLSSFSLMVAMAIMVASFRISVDDWLSHLLSADLYVHAGAGAALSVSQQQAIAGLPQVARSSFMRTTRLMLAPGRPPVALIARAIDATDPGNTLPLVGPALAAARIPGTAPPVWISEAMVDLYGYRPGQQLRLPLAGHWHAFTVAGIWRDYARQFGAIEMRIEDYRAASGDTEVGDAALWLRPEATAEQAVVAMRRLPFGTMLEFSVPGEIRSASLKIFDRSFAITYLLEAVAIVIGLFGVAATFSAQTLARAKEFGMLRHVGVTRRQILEMLALEGGLLTALGIAVGFLLGGAISLILVFVVNPQSFHWSMQLHVPWKMLAAVAMVLLGSAALTALLAGRHAVSGDAVRAVREDW